MKTSPNETTQRKLCHTCLKLREIRDLTAAGGRGKVNPSSKVVAGKKGSVKTMMCRWCIRGQFPGVTDEWFDGWWERQTKRS